jgi:AraC-like DNA-binding protein
VKSAEAQFPARYFLRLVNYLESIGVDRQALLRSTGIRNLEEPQGRLTLGQTEALIESAERLSGRSDLGFELGKLVKTSSHDILGYALLTSSNLAEVFRLLSRYQRLISPVFSLRLETVGARAEWVYRPVLSVSSRSMRIHQEAIAVSNHFEISSLMVGGLPAYDIHLSIPRPAHAARYKELAPARIHWGDAEPGLRMSMDASLLARPLAMADPRTMRSAEERCRALLHTSGGARRWSDWCRMMLNEAEDCQPTLDQLSDFVNLSSRTLSRYLEREGSSFRGLSIQVRIERARRMLAESDLAVTQIAYRLGYGDVASFDRSFKRETGLSPSSFRTANRDRR